MAKKKNPLTDKNHWIGWIIESAVVLGIFSLLPVEVMQSNIKILVALLLTTAGIDTIKHYMKLQ